MRLFMLALWGTVSLDSACVPAPPMCQIGPVQVAYTYNTTCSGVIVQKEGAWSWSLALSKRSVSEAEEQLKQQQIEQGWSLQELRFHWRPVVCSEAGETPLMPAAINRLVLEPDPTTDSGVAPLLVCRPTGDQTTAIKQDMLLACYRGNSKQITCTIQLKVKP